MDHLTRARRRSGGAPIDTKPAPAVRSASEEPASVSPSAKVADGFERIPASSSGAGAMAAPGALPDALDLSRPVPELSANPRALALVKQLADNPALNLDGDTSRLTRHEWELALLYLHTFPPSMRAGIHDLRRFFPAPAPSVPAIELATLPEPLRSQESTLTALYTLIANPSMRAEDLPGFITDRELAEAQAHPERLFGSGAAGIAALREYLRSPPPGLTPFDPGEEEGPFPGLQVAYSDGATQLKTDEALGPGAAEATARRTEAAFRYDLQAEQVSGMAGVEAPFTIGVVSDARFQKVTGGISAGFASGGDAFYLPDTEIGGSPFESDVTAHELSHLVDARLAGDRLVQIPVFLQEGKAWVLGDRYRADASPDPAAMAREARFLSNITAEQAHETVTHFLSTSDESASSSVYAYGEQVGALFVEFLRTRFHGGIPDAVPRLARMTEAVGKGASFAQAFREQLGGSPFDAETDFVDFVRRTQGDPAARLSGTIWEASAPRSELDLTQPLPGDPDSTLLAIARSLATNPYVSPGGDPAKLGVHPWEAALAWKYTWQSAATEDGLARLRSQFSAEPLPDTPGLDLTRAPDALLEQPNVAEALVALIRSGLRRDPVPGFISLDELRAAEASPSFSAAERAGLQTVVAAISPATPPGSVAPGGS